MTQDSPDQPAVAPPVATSGNPPAEAVAVPPFGRNGPAAQSDDSLKETIESIIIAFILAFVFRAYVVEAFVIPTGSMAPTLLGRHVRADCPECGYQFTMDPAESFGRAAHDHTGEPLEASDVNLRCPMCQHIFTRPDTHQPSAGDRILVHKFIYSLTQPRRWDVVVFKNPSQPDQNYIKRLVGLPGESLWIIEGNIYTKPNAAGPEAWGIARKTQRRGASVERVQRDVFVPIYHSRHVPLRYRANASNQSTWRPPWAAEQGDWSFADGRTYHQQTDQVGTIRFDFDRFYDLPGLAGPMVVQYPYNQLDIRTSELPLEDVRLAATVTAEGPGLSLTLSTTARLDDPAVEAQATRRTIAAVIAANGEATLAELPDIDANKAETAANSPALRTLAGPVHVGPFKPGQARRVELWFVDQEASLWVDGHRVLVWQFELPIDTLKQRATLSPADLYPQVRITTQGAPARLREVDLDRDLYYTDHLDGFGNWSKPISSRQLHVVQLTPDEFYCLGDNSPHSKDSRIWEAPDPWIQLRMLSHRKPLHAGGVVPRRLMMGRAFFVYFPAPLRMSPEHRGLIPNFGDMRFIH